MASSEDAVSIWSCLQVAKWLEDEGFSNYVDLLCNQHRLDGLGVLALTEADLRGPPLSITVLGDIKRMAVALRRLQRQNRAQLDELGLQASALSINSVGPGWRCSDEDDSGTELRLRSGGDRYRYAEAPCHTHSNGRCRQQRQLAGRLDPEVWKTVLSALYVFFVFGFTSFVMVIVHERVPDMRTYPPLPDIFLDRWVRRRASLNSCFSVNMLSYLISAIRV